MVEQLEFETNVLEQSMHFFETRLEQEFTDLEKRLQETDQQLSQSFAEVQKQIEAIAQTQKLQATGTEAELDAAIQAAELVISRGGQGLEQMLEPGSKAAVDAFRKQLQSAVSLLESFGEQEMAQLRGVKEEASAYVKEQIVPYGAYMEQYAQEQETAKTQLMQQLGYQ